MAINRPPVPTLAPATQTIAAGGSVTFTTGATDPDNDTPLTCTINYGEPGGATVTLGSCAGSVSRSFATPGTYTVTLTARDPFGATATATSVITVTGGTANPPPVPTLSLAPKTINVGGSTTATVGASDPDNAASELTCSVNWGNGVVGPFLPCTTSARNFTYNAAGLFTVTVTARDPAGAAGTVSDTIRVLAPETNTPPEIVNLRGFPEGVASYRLNANSCYSLQQVCIKYTIRDVDPGDTPFRTTVNWGDGSPTYTPNSIPGQNIPLLAFHNYAATGTYNVVVTATDRRGASSTQTIPIRIDP